jgi:hypothetical protein
MMRSTPFGERRQTSVALVLGFAVTLAVPTALLPTGADFDASAKKGKGKSKTITRTFDGPARLDILQLGAGDPFPATLQVGGFKKAKVKDVNVVLRDFNHTFPDDVDVLLVSPEGESAFILSDVGTNNDLFEIGGVTLTLDDEAEDPLPDANNLVSGTFRPTNGDPDLNGDESGDDFPAPAPQPGGSALSVFDGMNPNGEWQLFVVDDRSGDAGFFGDGWALEITAEVAVAGSSSTA